MLNMLTKAERKKICKAAVSDAEAQMRQDLKTLDLAFHMMPVLSEAGKSPLIPELLIPFFNAFVKLSTFLQ